MKIPEVAARMREIAEEIQDGRPETARELRELADELRRRSSVIRSSVTSAPISPKLIADIREFSELNPSLSYQTIAKRFNVNPGRVSEALRGKRK